MCLEAMPLERDFAYVRCNGENVRMADILDVAIALARAGTLKRPNEAPRSLPVISKKNPTNGGGRRRFAKRS